VRWNSKRNKNLRKFTMDDDIHQVYRINRTRKMERIRLVVLLGVKLSFHLLEQFCP
jgi:homoserine kinase